MNADYLNNDYQLDDMENEAVNKSQTAKRVLIGVGALAGGAGIAYAAGLVGNEDTPLTDDQQLDVNALLDGANAGAVEGFPIQPETPPAPVVHQHIHIEAPQEHVPEVNVETTTIVYGEDGKPMMIIEEGTIDGRMFAVVDQNCDGVGDVLIVDFNNDGRYEENEAVVLDKDTPYYMGHGELREVDVNGDPIIHQNYGDGGEDIAFEDHDGEGRGRDDLDDIDNDFNGRSGERYDGDLAENNPDYNNHGDTGHYSAGEAEEVEEITFSEEEEIEFDEEGDGTEFSLGTRGSDDIEDYEVENNEEIHYDHTSSEEPPVFEELAEEPSYSEPADEPSYDDSADEQSYSEPADESSYSEPADEPSYEPESMSDDYDSATDDVIL